MAFLTRKSTNRNLLANTLIIKKRNKKMNLFLFFCLPSLPTPSAISREWVTIGHHLYIYKMTILRLGNRTYSLMPCVYPLMRHLQRTPPQKSNRQP